MMMNDKARSLRMAWAILAALVEGGHLEEGAARRAITACRDSWASIRERVVQAAAGTSPMTATG